MGLQRTRLRPMYPPLQFLTSSLYYCPFVSVNYGRLAMLLLDGLLLQVRATVFWGHPGHLLVQPRGFRGVHDHTGPVHQRGTHYIALARHRDLPLQCDTWRAWWNCTPSPTLTASVITPQHWLYTYHDRQTHPLPAPVAICNKAIILY